MLVMVKIRRLLLPIIQHQSKTNATSHTLCEKNLSMQNSKRFHCGLFEVEILEIFTIAFLLEVIIGA